MKLKSFIILAIGTLFALLLTSCTAPTPQSASVDMTVVVPIHSSSLEYFDYVITYRDNLGNEIKDTVDGGFGGIVVDDFRRANMKQHGKKDVSVAKESLNGFDCYTMTVPYASLPVSCTAMVEMVPTVHSSSSLSLFFYVPKPYIFPNIRFGSNTGTSTNQNHIFEYLDRIRINSMSLSDFISTYGSVFTSHASVYPTPDGGYDVQIY